MELNPEWGIILVVVVLWLSGIVLRWLQLRVPTVSSEYDLLTWSKILVGAAEQLYTKNEDKFAYVIGQLRAKFPRMNDTELRAVLEWVVYQLQLDDIFPFAPTDDET